MITLAQYLTQTRPLPCLPTCSRSIIHGVSVTPAIRFSDNQAQKSPQTWRAFLKGLATVLIQSFVLHFFGIVCRICLIKQELLAGFQPFLPKLPHLHFLSLFNGPNLSAIKAATHDKMMKASNRGETVTVREQLPGTGKFTRTNRLASEGLIKIIYPRGLTVTLTCSSCSPPHKKARNT